MLVETKIRMLVIITTIPALSNFIRSFKLKKNN